MHMKLSTMFLHLPYMFLDESDLSITESIPSAVPDHDDFETILENGQEEIIQPVANNETSAVILKQLIELKVICSRLDSRLETIEKMINTGKASVAFQNYSLLPNLPLNYIEELTSFEEVLSSADGKMQLTNLLEMIGGSNLKDGLKRGLCKLFTNQLGSKCPWTGAKGNFPLKELSVIQCLRGLLYSFLDLSYYPEYQATALKVNFVEMKEAKFEE
ncbi:hypothetical protein FQA39_LY07534 [Lamprigera yunnana]|nr:hypothetical protein FQA39_LY07534 [Lamprigera yunnana]